MPRGPCSWQGAVTGYNKAKTGQQWITGLFVPLSPLVGGGSQGRS